MFNNHSWSPADSAHDHSRRQQTPEEPKEEDMICQPGARARRTLAAADRVQSVILAMQSEIEDIHQRIMRDVQKDNADEVRSSSRTQDPDTELDLYDHMSKASPPSPSNPAGSGQSASEPSVETLDPFVAQDDFWPYMTRSPYSPLKFALNPPRNPKSSAIHDISISSADRMRLVMAFTDLYHHAHSEDDSSLATRANLGAQGDGSSPVQAHELPGSDVPELAHAVAPQKSDIAPQESFAGTIADLVRDAENFADDFMKVFTRGERSTTSAQNQTRPVDGQMSIVSTMTRSETRTLPDGSTETRKMLKRRFADGKEEVEESVDTFPATREVPDWLRTHLAAAEHPTVDKQTQTAGPKVVHSSSQVGSADLEKPRKGGWFWR